MKSNRASWSDVAELVTEIATTDADGYKSIQQSVRQVFCTVCSGVARSEFYEAYKVGLRLSITVEVWEEEYNSERILRHNGKEYSVVRTYPTGHGTLELTCSEVIR